MADRNSAKELSRDIAFLDELLSDLEAGRLGDRVRLDSLQEKLRDWSDELKALIK